MCLDLEQNTKIWYNEYRESPASTRRLPWGKPHTPIFL
nr:MAG TPA: hypothetical protein [Caudoviricetes sp.]